MVWRHQCLLLEYSVHMADGKRGVGLKPELDAVSMDGMALRFRRVTLYHAGTVAQQ